MSFQCRICGNAENNRTHRAREMMFGTREEFDYVECGKCGTVQIARIPDLTEFYPKNYYSFDGCGSYGPREKLSHLLLAAYLKYRDRRLRGSSRATFAAVRRKLDAVDFDARVFDLGSGALSVIESGVGRGARILDVGCGDGSLLSEMERLGFRSLAGIDVFIEGDRTLAGGTRIRKIGLDETDERFDVIMFHHSLEHVPDPVNTLRSARGLLNEDGTCLVRIPLLAYAWETYGVNWVGMDPPRHLYLFSEDGFRQAAEVAGFRVGRVVYDSTSFQFSGSERYAQDIALAGSKKDKDIFPKSRLREWRRTAAKLNSEGKGDQAAFYLNPAA